MVIHRPVKMFMVPATSTKALAKTACDSMCKSTPHMAQGNKAGVGEQFKELFTKAFNTADWPARWHCGNWTDLHGWVYICSDLLIWASYFAIPFLLFRILNKRKDIPFPGILWLFIAFILFCGTTHLLDAIIFWWPAYRLSAIIRLTTAIISFITVIALYKILPMVYKLRTLEQLEKEIEERKKAKQDARNHQIQQQATEELMRKKDEFMSVASHELKTPITSVKASIQILERIANKNETVKEMAPFLEKASKQVDKLTGIINDLLDVTKIQEGKLEMHKTKFNLMALIKECAEQCIPPNRNLTVDIKGDDELVVYADRNRIDQVLCNLLTNAIKYSPKSDKVDILVNTTGDGNIKISVTDYGIGIPANRLEHIFSRFYRVENTSQNFPGVGLGLYISSEIIKRHNGQIGVDTVFGEGSTFYFTLPTGEENK